MADGALKKYDFKTKNNWRGWQWNRIEERLDKIKKDKIILYLSGSEPLDIKHGLKRGFKKYNLIGIDNSVQNIECLRKKGFLGICDDLNSLLFMWPDDFKVDAIIADFCGGMTKQTFLFLDAIVYSSAIKYNTVISINLLRGRDPQVNDDKKIWGYESLHRGEFFYKWYALRELQRIGLIDRKNPQLPWENKKTSELYEKAFVINNPVFNSYRSGNLFYDSCVFSCGYTNTWFDFENTSFKDEKIKKRILKCKNKISALRAIRTMRMAA